MDNNMKLIYSLCIIFLVALVGIVWAHGLDDKNKDVCISKEMIDFLQEEHHLVYMSRVPVDNLAGVMREYSIDGTWIQECRGN